MHGHQELAFVYPSSPPPCPQGLGSSSHQRCESVGSIPTQVLKFLFPRKKILGFSIQVLQLSIPDLSDFIIIIMMVKKDFC